MNLGRKGLIGFILITLFLSGAKGQKEIPDFLNAGIHDATILTDAYLRPYGEMLGKTLNGGWYNSADVHKVGGFDFTVGINMAMAPGSAKEFDVTSLPLEGGWGFKDPNIHIAPTAAGDMGTRPVLTLGGEDVLNLPNGSGFDKFPMPLIQIGVGLPYHIELSARFIPAFDFSDAGKVHLFGFAVKHSIKEYIPVIKRVPFLNSSLMVGYTNFGSELGVAYNGGTNQKLNIDASGFTTRLLIGANFPIIALYTGVGYGSTSSDFALKGDYLINGSNEPNPLSVGYETSGFDANAGFRLRFGIIALHGDYSIGDYSMLSVGIGISFR